MHLPVADHIVHLLEYFQRIPLLIFLLHKFLEKAAAVSRMACRSHLGNLCQNRILVTVQRQRLHILKMTGSQPFHPKLVPAAAPVSHPSGFQRRLIRFFIHIRQHQHFIRLVILNDDRNHAVAVFLEFRPRDRAFKRIDRNSRFPAGCLAFHQILSRTAHTCAGHGFHLRICQKICRCVIRRQNHQRKRADSCDFFQLLFIAENHAGKCLNPLPVSLKHLHVRHENRDFFLSKFSGHFLQQFTVRLLRKIQHRLLTSRIQDLLDVLHPADISPADHRDFRPVADPDQGADRLVMLCITLRKIQNQQFIRPSVGKICRQFLHRKLRDHRLRAKTGHCLPVPQINDRNQQFSQNTILLIQLICIIHRKRSCRFRDCLLWKAPRKSSRQWKPPHPALLPLP